MQTSSTSLTRELPFAEPARLDFKADVVGVSALPVAPGVAPRLTIETPGEAGDLRVDVEVRGGTVYATVATGDTFRRLLRNQWKIVCRLELPHGIDAAIRTDAGQIEVRGLTGSFDLRTEAGRVALHGVNGRLTVRTEASKIDCDGFSGSIDASTSAGAIALEATALAAGTHTLRADVGKIDVRLPAGAPIRVETRTSIGRTRNSFGSGPGEAQAVLRVQTEVGAITVQSSERLGAASAALGSGEQARQAAIMQILEQVARHEISAEEGNRRIAALH